MRDDGSKPTGLSFRDRAKRAACRPELRQARVRLDAGFTRDARAPERRGTAAVIRPVLTEVALFLAPFAAYAVFLWVTKTSMFDRVHWPPKVLASLAIAALVLMIGSFVILAHFSGAPPGSTYVPAHVEDGRFVPGQVR
jgi:hypothetical protein